MHDQTNPTRPTRSLGFGANAIYSCALAALGLILLIIGMILSPVIRVIALMLLLAYTGFFLAVAIAASLGYMDVPTETPGPAPWKLGLGLVVGLIILLGVFGLEWAVGFLVYVASVVGILVLMERRRRIAGPNAF